MEEVKSLYFTATTNGGASAGTHNRSTIILEKEIHNIVDFALEIPYLLASLWIS